MKATFPDGTLFEGTPEEFNAVRGYSGTAVAAKTSGNGSPQFWNAVNAEAFWNSLDTQHSGGRQKKILRFLIKKGGQAAYEEVKNHLDVESGQELAGVLANITRNARRETEYKKAFAVEWKADGKGDHFYRIPNDLLKFLKNLE